MDDLARLMNRERIRDVLVAYCRGVDRRDWDLLRSCYHSDAIDDHSVLVGGPQDLVDWLDRRHQNMPTSVHMVMNVGFLEESDDRVLTETYCMTVQVLEAGSLTRNTVGCRYLDVFEDRGDGWKIAHRKVVLEWIDAVDAQADFLDERYLRSARDRTDPLYEHLKRGVL